MLETPARLGKRMHQGRRTDGHPCRIRPVIVEFYEVAHALAG